MYHIVQAELKSPLTEICGPLESAERAQNETSSKMSLVTTARMGQAPGVAAQFTARFTNLELTPIQIDFGAGSHL